VSSATFVAYIDGRVKLVEQRLVQEMEQEMQRALQSELGRLKDLDDHGRRVHEASRRLERQILGLHCPRCEQAFLDFDGCFALTCSRCRCGFCGWCLVDAGQDAHAHVRVCPEVPPHQRKQPLFPEGGFGAFEAHHRQRRGQQLCSFLAGLADDDVRRGVLCEVSGQLQGMVEAQALAGLMQELGLA